MNTANKFRVAFSVDGSFLPIRNGAFYSTYNLMCALEKSKQVNPILTISYRSWDNHALYFQQPFSTAFIKPVDYYVDTGVLNYIFSILGIDIVHFLNAEEVLNQGQRLQKTNVKIIYEAINIEHTLYMQLGEDNDVVTKMKRLQTKACQVADHILCRSEIDKNGIIQMGIDPNKITVCTGAINVSNFQFEERKKKRYRILFLGHMYYPPNENALELIVNHILPELKLIDDRYTLTVVGIAPPSMVSKYREQSVIFTEGVDDLSSELLEYDIAICPLFEGSGTRLKILDYLASGIPTITTTLGIEGLEQEINNHVVVENDIHNYANQIDRVMNSLNEFIIPTRQGRKFVETFYNWDQCLEPFLQIYQQLQRYSP